MLNPETNEIIELKTSNARAIREGWKQVKRYVEEQERLTGEKGTGAGGDLQQVKTENPVKVIVDAYLSAKGFRRSKSSWYRQDELTQVLDIQKSNYSDAHYINVGFYLHGPEQVKKSPREEECHVRIRMKAVDGAEEEALDASSAILVDERTSRLVRLMARADQLLERARTVNGLRAAYQDGSLKAAIVVAFAKNLLAAV